MQAVSKKPFQRVEPWAQSLKDTVALMSTDQKGFARSPLCQPDTLRRLYPGDYDRDIAPDRTPIEQAQQVLKVLAMSRYIEAIRVGDSAHVLAQGILLFWYMFLEPVSTSRAVPSFLAVASYCSHQNHLEDFIAHGHRFIKSLALSPDEQLSLQENFDERLRVSARGFELAQDAKGRETQRRSFSNYVHDAAHELAVMIQSRAPEVFEQEPGQKQAIAVADRLPSLEALRQFVARECASAPEAYGQRLDIQTTIERTVQVVPVAGNPIPLNVPSGYVPFSNMSGLLVGLPGSGRTSYLKRLAYEAAQSPGQGQDWPATVYVRAPDFVIYARNHRTIYDFVADQVRQAQADSERNVQQLRQELEARDQAGQLLVLVDDLDRLAEPDQEEVIRQLAFSPAVVCVALPWQVERLGQAMLRPQGRRPELGEFRLADLEAQQQREMLARLAERSPREFDLDVALSMLEQVPDLARLPLGVAAIHAQIINHARSRSMIAHRALEEMFARAHLPKPKFEGAWPALDPAARSLLYAAMLVGWRWNDARVWEHEPERPDAWTVSQAEFERDATQWNCRWDQLIASRLFEPCRDWRGREALRFINQDIVCHCVGLASRMKRLELRRDIAESQTEEGELIQRALDYEDSMEQDDASGHL
jgi:AAA domain